MSLNKEELLEKANFYKGGNSGIEHDEVDFWLWEQKHRGLDFIVELPDKKVSCMEPNELWCMDVAVAKESKFIDVADEHCNKCPYADRCSKVDMVKQVAPGSSE